MVTQRGITRTVAFIASAVIAATAVGAEEAVPLPEEERIFEFTQAGNVGRDDGITFYVRMPKGWAGPDEWKQPGAFGRRQYSVRSVLVVLPWGRGEEMARNFIAVDGAVKEHIAFADEHDLAVVTWTNFKGYTTAVSGDEMTEAQWREYDRNFNRSLAIWERALKRLIRTHDLPPDGWLLYGYSGGAQMGHRVALRRPQYFSGIHIHINSSYDRLTRDARTMLWCVTTGEREYGYRAARRFYHDALEMDYHMIFKAGENLGHNLSPQILGLGLAFFEYLMNFVPDHRVLDWKAPPVDKFHLMRNPDYIGDYLNHEVFTRQQADKFLPDSAIVALPNRSLAEAWGEIIE